MKVLEHNYTLHLSADEIGLLVNALDCNCRCYGNDITEETDTEEKDRLIKEYRPYRELLGELSKIVGRYIYGDYYER